MLSFESAFQEYYLPFFDSAERKEKVAPSFYLAISKLAPLSSISIWMRRVTDFFDPYCWNVEDSSFPNYPKNSLQSYFSFPNRLAWSCISTLQEKVQALRPWNPFSLPLRRSVSCNLRYWAVWLNKVSWWDPRAPSPPPCPENDSQRGGSWST